MSKWDQYGRLSFSSEGPSQESTHPGRAENPAHENSRHTASPETQQHPVGQEGLTETGGSLDRTPGGDSGQPPETAMLSEDSEPDSAQGSVNKVVAATGELSLSTSDTGQGAEGKVSEEKVVQEVADTRELSMSTSDTGRGAEGNVSERKMDEEGVERAESPSSAKPVKSEDDQNEVSSR